MELQESNLQGKDIKFFCRFFFLVGLISYKFISYNFFQRHLLSSSNANNTNPDKGHDQQRCQKCRELGHLCLRNSDSYSDSDTTHDVRVEYSPRYNNIGNIGYTENYYDDYDNRYDYHD